MSGQVTRVYRQLLKTALRFQDYNFRTYFHRRIREEFRRGEMSLSEAHSHLALLQRQATVQGLYTAAKSVVETQS